MKEFKGNVAVITGGASGIGRALAERFAEEGMKIVIADVEQAALDRAESEMKADGAEVLAVRTDVSKVEDVEALAAKTVEAFGTAHILCNNAGVGSAGRIWEVSLSDWEWVLGVNLWGVIYGLRAFVPIMLKNEDPGHIVNTASMAGLTTTAGMSPYNVSKHGVVTLSEALYHELRQMDSQLHVSVLCPGWVDTKINLSDRNRPGGPIAEENLGDGAKLFQQAVGQALKRGLAPKDVAELVLESIIDERFYILPHPHWKNMIEARMLDILNGRSPAIVPPPEI